MANIRDIGSIAQKWGDVTAQKSQYYAAGIASPRKDWAQETSAAEGAYNEGVQAAIGRGAFSKGVQKAGTAKWKTNAANLGVQRYPTGVQNAKPAYAAGFGPYVAVIQNTTLPPRGSKGSPQNMQRSSVMANALHMAKINM